MDVDLNLEIPDRLSEGAWHGHVIFAQWIIQVLRPSIVVELGTYNGDSYFSFCQSVKKNNLPTQCHAVDSWKGDIHIGSYEKEIFISVDQYNRDNYSAFSTLHRCFFDEAVEQFEDGSIDLLHIDGSHSYEAVSHDFNTWLPKLSANAIVLFHDTNEIKVGFGVWRLWDELAEKYPKTHFNFLHSHGLGVLGIGSTYAEALNKLFEAKGEEIKAYRDFFSTLTEVLIEPVENRRMALENQRVTIYVDSGNGLSEKEKECVELSEMQGRIKFSLSNYQSIKQIRLDFGSVPVFLHLSNLVAKKGDESLFVPIVSCGNYKKHIQIPSIVKDVAPEMLFLFNEEKPQLVMNFLDESYNSISFEYRIFGFHELTSYSLIRDLVQSNSELFSQKEEYENVAFGLNIQIDDLQQKLLSKEKCLAEINLLNEKLSFEITEKLETAKNLDAKLRTKDDSLAESNLLIEELQSEILKTVEQVEGLQQELDFKNNSILAKDNEIGSLREQLERELKQTNNTLNLLKGNERNKLVSQYKKHLPSRLAGQLLQFCFHPFVYLRKRRDILEVLHSGLFDDAYYLEQNPDLYLTTVNILKHYMLYGWEEGRNPSREFDANYYLTNNDDVKKAGMNPLLHYVRFGKKEGRVVFARRNENSKGESSEPSDKGIGKIRDNVVSRINECINGNLDILAIRKSGLFDKEFYLAQYSDVKEAGIDPLHHYHFNGWKEGRNPNRNFNTSFYLISNPDVAELGIDPFYHYIVAGKGEGRMISHPCQVKVQQLKEKYYSKLKPKNNSLPIQPLTKVEKIKSIFSDSTLKNKKGIVVSLSHDSYIECVGGIQLCIIEEQKSFNEDDYVYIHLSPDLPNLSREEDLKANRLRVIADGIEIGYFKSEDILGVFKESIANCCDDIILVIHSLIGYSNRFISSVCSEISYSRKFFWLHDYYTICSGYNLLRNGVEFCNAPAVDSNACQICVFGEDRVKMHSYISELFTNNLFEIISPSEYSLKYWKGKTSFQFKRSHVLPHRIILPQEKMINWQAGDKLKIAFVGYPAYHKGWNEFEQLLSIFGNDERYQFYHIGLNSTSNSRLTFVESKISVREPDVMIEKMRELGVDYCFIWPKWNETFCLTAFESIASGAMLLTHYNSGNVCELVKSTQKGICYFNIQELVEDMNTGRLFEFIQKERKDGMFIPDYVKSNMSYYLVKNEKI